MSKLLAGDSFDLFLLEEATIQTATTFSIDGHIQPDFYPLADRTPEKLPYPLVCWSEVRQLCFDLIKGKNTPLYFKFVLQLRPEKVAELMKREAVSLRDIPLKALVVTIKYDGSKAILTTGTSYQSFVMDKTADVVWDRELAKYLSTCQIPYDIL